MSEANGDIDINQVDYCGIQDPLGPRRDSAHLISEQRLNWSSEATRILKRYQFMQIESKHMFLPQLPTIIITQQTEEEHEEREEDRCHQHFPT